MRACEPNDDRTSRVKIHYEVHGNGSRTLMLLPVRGNPLIRQFVDRVGR
jgi:hypothetical protein